MRDILKLSITLAVVGIVSAASLAAVNNITAPIIAQRQEQEYMQTLEAFFPEVDSFESDTRDDNQFDTIFNSKGELIGVLGTIGQQGYGDVINYNLAVDGTGSIIGMRVVSHAETPGVGDVITTGDFQKQFIGKNHEDPIVAGDDVDAVSGATISSAAMINSIRGAVKLIAENYLGFASAKVDIADVSDGTYQGSAPGMGGAVVVEVTVQGGKITAIEVIEQDETPTYFVESYPLIPDTIIAEQHFDIDTKTGATISATAIIEAVQNALRQALGITDEEPEPEPEPAPADIDLSKVPDGQYSGCGEGLFGDIEVAVEVAGGKIISIEIISQEETAEFFKESNPLIPDRIIEEQSLNIDTATGASFSAQGIVEAVRNALAQALGNDGGGEN